MHFIKKLSHPDHIISYNIWYLPLTFSHYSMSTHCKWHGLFFFILALEPQFFSGHWSVLTKGMQFSECVKERMARVKAKTIFRWHLKTTGRLCFGSIMRQTDVLDRNLVFNYCLVVSLLAEAERHDLAGCFFVCFYQRWIEGYYLSKQNKKKK